MGIFVIGSTFMIMLGVVIARRSFTIDHVNDCFLKDGKYFKYASGSLHYFRVPEYYWEDRLLKLKYAGFNAVQTYVEWRSHEKYPGKYVFDGNLNLEKFLRLANDTGLLVILRPGPYIDAERDLGGLPSWLIKKPIKLRTSDIAFLDAVKKWFDVLFTIIKPYLYGNIGPIIMVQVENEYGSFSPIDDNYKLYLQSLIYGYVEENAVLFTTDGNNGKSLFNGGVPGVLSTIDFGSGVNVADAMTTLRIQQPTGPLVNSEYYSGWLDHWGQPHSVCAIDRFITTFEELLKMNVSVNVYMFIGGTSFGFDSGANLLPGYMACPTSYDYDALLTEAGDPTPKYFATRKLLSKYFPVPNGPPPNPTPKAMYGKVVMKSKLSLFSTLEAISKGKMSSLYPLSFEEIDVSEGFVVYENKLDNIYPSPALLKIPGIRDRGYVYVNDVYQGILSRTDDLIVVPIISVKGDVLKIIVENQGRNCYGSNLKDNKGITSNVTLHDNILTGWKMTRLPLHNVSVINRLLTITYPQPGLFKACTKSFSKGMNFFSGKFIIDEGQLPEDTFVKLDNWGKGVIWINDFNLGRYWPHQGPQVTLYVPKSLLKPHPFENIVTVFEQERHPCDGMGEKCYVEFINYAVINGSTPHCSISTSDYLEASKYRRVSGLTHFPPNEIS